MKRKMGEFGNSAIHEPLDAGLHDFGHLPDFEVLVTVGATKVALFRRKNDQLLNLGTYSTHNLIVWNLIIPKIGAHRRECHMGPLLRRFGVAERVRNKTSFQGQSYFLTLIKRIISA